jgi:protein phosphatase
MSQPKPQLCCVNPNCAAPLNDLGNVNCAACGTPLQYRYLWAVGDQAVQVPVGTQVSDRYHVSAPQIWLDTQPNLAADFQATKITAIAPYLALYPHRLHLPEVYGFYQATPDAQPDFLLENVPLDQSGVLCPAIAQAWSQTAPVRQAYWLWQLLELWTPLQQQGVAASLLVASNIRVEGWRVRLCQLYRDTEVLPPSATTGLGLADLGEVWASWVNQTQPPVTFLEAICALMQIEGTTLTTIATRLNQCLLEQAAQLPLYLKLAAGTDTGKQRSHNEDACYPLTLGTLPPIDGLFPRLAIVCDGIGGHEGGEVASQMAVKSLKLQVQALLAEVTQQEELVSPQLLQDQLAAIVRVVNNLIAAQNDTQGREERRRMGTTLVMALQLPQQVRLADGSVCDNGHEIYLVSVGDSRAYWITEQSCHRLTVDDDVAAREVQLGRSLYREVLSRPDAGSLTQALGTREGEHLRPTVQRLILEEDGILLLCSDGLSDHDVVEQTWMEVGVPVLRGKQTLDAALKIWIDLANQYNGYDNTTIALLHGRVTSILPEVALPLPSRDETDWSDASRALMDTQPVTRTPVKSRSLSAVAIAAILLLSGAGVGLFAWSQINPSSFQELRERIFPNPG